MPFQNQFGFPRHLSKTWLKNQIRKINNHSLPHQETLLILNMIDNFRSTDSPFKILCEEIIHELLIEEQLQITQRPSSS
tara:strand:- start:927 stop:1163 length:237 start_codon:yes stop_codon:yes gene_type:complete